LDYLTFVEQSEAFLLNKYLDKCSFAEAVACHYFNVSQTVKNLTISGNHVRSDFRFVSNAVKPVHDAFGPGL